MKIIAASGGCSVYVGTQGRRMYLNCELKPRMLVFALSQFLSVCLNKLQFPEERLALLNGISPELSNSVETTISVSHWLHVTLSYRAHHPVLPSCLQSGTRLGEASELSGSVGI